MLEIERPPKPRHDPRDLSIIVQYWSTQPDTRIRFTLFSMFLCLEYPTGILVFTSLWALRRTIMPRISIDPKYKGGSIRMAAALAAIDRGVPIDVVLNTGPWASWQVFDEFYNRSRLQASAPSIGITSLA